MRNLSLIGALLLYSVQVYGQQKKALQDSSYQIPEVTITALAKKKIETDLKMSVSVDEFLASAEQISFVKRGAFAWEPLLHSMSSERSIITLDGMHIFGACTDKMDPVTSYVESNNLRTIDIKSGQAGSLHGATVAGSIDMQRKNTPFGRDKTWYGGYETGFEFNNKQYFNLGNLSYSSEKLVVDASIAARKAGNYSAGDNKRVNHSQYNKFNASTGIALKTGDLSSVRVDAIYDQAKDVGFPALPMDLWRSRALITSVNYKQFLQKEFFRLWDSKIYYNTIEHYMDDTKRPENLVHMDMPGWSTTYGLISKITLGGPHHYQGEIQLNAYENLSIAEMTMYPQDRSSKTMFAYTWPWVRTRYVGLSTTNSWKLSRLSKINVGGSLGAQYSHAKYAEFNRIFYPNASPSKNRMLPAVHATYNIQIQQFDLSIGTGYGHRAPSVSEGYGYYIYNSFDRYDYVGNPDLNNEISYEVNAHAAFKTQRLGVHLKANYFYIDNYIVGRILGLGSPMNYQSVGVKGYTALDYARLFTASLKTNYGLLHHLHWKGTLAYARATDNQNKNLPFIRPLTYQTSLHFMHNDWGIQAALNGDLAQKNYSPEYGEDWTAAYHIWALSTNYSWRHKGYKAALQAGVENIFNKEYTSYSDWGNIPCMGRNIYTSLKINF